MDLNVIENMEKAQSDIAKKWKGMEINYIGRPGCNNLSTGKSKRIKADEYMELEEKRFRSMFKAICKVKEQEDEKLGISTPSSKSSNEIINFKTIKESQIMKDGPPALTYSKSAYVDQGELLYKMLKTEGRLIRSVLEVHGFSHTDSHDWNILWT